MNCRQIQKELSAYVDNEVRPELRAAIESHLTGCPDCQRRVTEWQQLAAGVHALPTAQPPPDFLREVRRKIADNTPAGTATWRDRLFFPVWKVPLEAAALVAVLATATFLLRTPPPPAAQPTSEAAATDQLAPAPAATPAIAEMRDKAPILSREVPAEKIIVESADAAGVRRRAAKSANELRGQVLLGRSAQEFWVELPADSVGGFKNQFGLGDRDDLLRKKDQAFGTGAVKEESTTTNTALPQVILQIQIVPPNTP